MARIKKVDYIYGVGRRKESSARVRLYRGKGENTVNNMVATKYFPGAVSQKSLEKPFGATETSDKYYFSARVLGGGKEGQLEAVVLGIARCLVKASPEKNRAILRKLSLLTRDSRIRERRMVEQVEKQEDKSKVPNVKFDCSPERSRRTIPKR
jgi:small subunit ribosomal protein S9